VVVMEEEEEEEHCARNRSSGKHVSQTASPGECWRSDSRGQVTPPRRGASAPRNPDAVSRGSVGVWWVVSRLIRIFHRNPNR
jgi:hypothetical protein